jgi:(E)-4-hydroxy-3-methylbut-2-enyl-diphosphate synthase
LAIDLNKIMGELEARLGGRKTPVKISVLGCVVNGPGEAREADIGIAAGNGKGVIFRNGEIVKNVLEHEMVDALIEEVELWERENMDKGTVKPEARDGKIRLPVLT